MEGIRKGEQPRSARGDSEGRGEWRKRGTRGGRLGWVKIGGRWREKIRGRVPSNASIHLPLVKRLEPKKKKGGGGKRWGKPELFAGRMGASK